MTKSGVFIMELLATYDKCGSYAATARVHDCAPNTVRNHVKARESDSRSEPRRPVRSKLDAYRDQITAAVNDSDGAIKAQKVFEMLVASGFTGSLRITERAVRDAKRVYALAQEDCRKFVGAAAR